MNSPSFSQLSRNSNVLFSRRQPPRRAVSPGIRHVAIAAAGGAVRRAGGVLLPGARGGAVHGTAVAPVARVACGGSGWSPFSIDIRFLDDIFIYTYINIYIVSFQNI